MKINIFYPLIFYGILDIYSNELNREIPINQINERAVYKCYGYKSFSNGGSRFRGCCGDFNNTQCQACRYSIRLKRLFFHYEGTDRKDHSYSIDLGDFSIAAKELFETKTIEIANHANHDALNTFELYNKAKSQEAVDLLLPAFIDEPFKYIFNGSLGVNERMILFASIEVYLIDSITKYLFFIIKIESVYWKRYQFADTSCCTGFYSENCTIPCVHWFSINFDDVMHDHSHDINIENSGRNIRYEYYMYASDYEQSQKINFSIKVVSEYDDIDEMFLTNISYVPNKIHNLFNITGIHDNIVMNLSYSHNVKGYIHDDMGQKCYSIEGIDYCSDDGKQKSCYNGANDFGSCENEVKKCDNRFCNNHGICKVINDNACCLCNSGFKGKYCEKWYCEHDCSNIGVCVEPNICSCIGPYRGVFCEEYPCKDEIKNPCLHNGECYVANNSIKCYCKNKYTSGYHCEISNCSSECIYGECIYVKTFNIARCVCHKGYSGISCNISNNMLDLVRIGKKIYAYTVMCVLLSTLIIPIIFYLFSKTREIDRL